MSKVDEMINCSRENQFRHQCNFLPEGVEVHFVELEKLGNVHSCEGPKE